MQVAAAPYNDNEVGRSAELVGDNAWPLANILWRIYAGVSSCWIDHAIRGSLSAEKAEKTPYPINRAFENLLFPNPSRKQTAIFPSTSRDRCVRVILLEREAGSDVVGYAGREVLVGPSLEIMSGGSDEATEVCVPLPTMLPTRMSTARGLWNHLRSND
jgi:hypothetical protein